MTAAVPDASTRATALHNWPDEATIAAAALTVGSVRYPRSAVLRPLNIGGTTLCPVVDWDLGALAQRELCGVAPLTTVAEVRSRPQWLRDSPLEVRALIGVGGPTSVRRALRAWRSLAATVGMFCRYPARSVMLGAEYDLQGTSLVVVDDAGCQVYVEGDSGPRSGSTLDADWKRTFEERFYAWAIRTSSLPDRPAA